MAILTWIGGQGGAANQSNWAYASNWNTPTGTSGSAPSNGDTVYLNEQGQYPILTGLNQSATALTIYTSINKTFQIGTQTTGLRPGNNSVVYEGQVPVGVNAAELGSPWVYYSLYNDSTAVFVFGTSNNVANYSNSTLLNIDGGGSGTAIYVVGPGTSGSSYAPELTIGPSGITGTVNLIAVSGQGATVNVGPGVSLGAAQLSGGTTVLNCGVSGALSSSGQASVTVQGQGTIGTATVGGAAVFNNRNTASAIITTLTVLPEALADFSQNPATGTVTTLNQYASATRTSTVRVNAAAPAHISFGTRNYFDGGTLTLSS